MVNGSTVFFESTVAFRMLNSKHLIVEWNGVLLTTFIVNFATAETPWRDNVYYLRRNKLFQARI